MPRLRRGLDTVLGALALALTAGLTSPAVAAQEQRAPRIEDTRPELALMGTIPIFWGEATGLDDLIEGTATAHWARAQLEKDYRLVPLDYLSATALADKTRLFMAQPRGLTPEENVALDAWVRNGGHLLLFADPLMTGESRFGIGDRRRPQDVALLSPILDHWGLVLEYDESQTPGMDAREIAGSRIPVNLAGRFSIKSGAMARCAVESEVTLVRCTLGSGGILAFADAALLDHAGPWPGSEQALATLLSIAFGNSGENAGSAVTAQEAAARR